MTQGELPLKYFNLKEAMQTGLFISGTSGSGKTRLAFSLAEELMNEGVIVYAIDPSQQWGRNSPITRTQKITEWKGEIEFPVNRSTVFDVSMITWEERMQFTDLICKALLNDRKRNPHKRQPIFVFFEEGQLYFYQGSMRTPKNSPNAVELVTNGRNFNMRYGVITQFASMIDKILVKMTKQRYLGWSNETNDIKYLRSIIGKKWVDELPQLSVGEFIYSYPVRGMDTQKIKVPYWAKFGEEENTDFKTKTEGIKFSYKPSDMPDMNVTINYTQTKESKPKKSDNISSN
jgi:hypothetical protein